jgi:hypothetical protein
MSKYTRGWRGDAAKKELTARCFDDEKASSVVTIVVALNALGHCPRRYKYHHIPTRPGPHSPPWRFHANTESLAQSGIGPIQLQQPIDRVVVVKEKKE